MTSKEKAGTWYISISHSGLKNTVMINQVRNLDYRRLDKKIAVLDLLTFEKILKGIINLIEQK